MPFPEGYQPTGEPSAEALRMSPEWMTLCDDCMVGMHPFTSEMEGRCDLCARYGHVNFLSAYTVEQRFVRDMRKLLTKAIKGDRNV